MPYGIGGKPAPPGRGLMSPTRQQHPDTTDFGILTVHLQYGPEPTRRHDADERLFMSNSNEKGCSALGHAELVVFFGFFFLVVGIVALLITFFWTFSNQRHVRWSYGAGCGNMHH